MSAAAAPGVRTCLIASKKPLAHVKAQWVHSPNRAGFGSLERQFRSSTTDGMAISLLAIRGEVVLCS